jgi:hypothetical protein
MSWESTFFDQPLSSSFFCLPNSLCLVNHIIDIQPSRSCGSLSCRFCLSTWLFIFYLGYFVCHLGLCSLSDNCVCCLSLLDQVHYFAVIIYLIIISFHYLPFAVVHQFAVVHHIISFHYMSFVVVIYIISLAWLDDENSILWWLWSCGPYIYNPLGTVIHPSIIPNRYFIY